MDDTPETVTATVTPVALPDGWTVAKVSALVHELATNLYDIPVTLQKFGLSQAQYDYLCQNEFFKQNLEIATLEWNKPQSAVKRLALESAIGIEAALPSIVARMSKNSEPLTGVVAALKVLAELSGAVGTGNRPQEAPHERFQININLGADTQRFEKDRPTTGLVEIQPLPQGTSQGQAVLGISSQNGNSAEVQQIPEGA